MPEKPRIQEPFITRDTGTLILLMGQTGAGKSHFINVAAGRVLATVNDNQTSMDPEINSFVVRNFNKRSGPSDLVLVDTPGFDHIYLSDSDILKLIAEWLYTSCSLDVSFGGVVYLHDITQDRVAKHWPMDYLKSPEPAKHLLLTTVKWDRDSTGTESYTARENELRENVWRRVLAGGARICQFRNTRDSAWEVINNLLRLKPLELHMFEQELNRLSGHAIRGTAKPPAKKKGIFAKLFGFWRK
ncbi:unnamed protein product [Cyclocybe aegerita]|uniref:G domain-containing protein n=1 Tax=Cyclocybe aegerita TaxID=1973307 RepID=A0A8S0VRF3_CYCAE|nr:unnamed protein product [Cyclocybe aegerita]